MCGIAGFYGTGTDGVGRKMIDRISYRGPDHHEVTMIGNVCLAHARLSIIDLSDAANQPMFSSDRMLSIVFNGEIYNYKQLKQDLISSGFDDFNTQSDTEVLLMLYRKYGRDMLSQINGMFVFAIYDNRKNELFVARDRMGKKPLYYTQAPDAFVFGSELKALLQHPSVSAQINPDSLNRYLTFDYVPGPESILENISKLEPATYLVVKSGRIAEIKRYWQHNFTTSDISFDDAVDRLDTLLNDATGRRLMSDVPLGIFLSGGLDSSTIAWYAQKNSSQKINTFSIGFEDSSYDEQTYAEAVAKMIGTDHHVSMLTSQDTLKLIDTIYPKVDEPFADASLIPTYYLSRFTRQTVTVALGGDGSDELMAGYPTFISDKFKNLFNWLPKPALQVMLKTLGIFPVSDKNISLDFKVRQFLRGFFSKREHIHQLWLGSFLPSEKKSLFKPDFYERIKDKSGLSLIDSHFNDSPAEDDFHHIAYYYYRTYLPDDILFKVDRASMYNSLEVRAPFLDVNVVEFINSLPESYKHRGLNGKYILKKLMHKRLPDEIITRPKKGFGIPLSDWIRKDLKKIISQTILQDNPYFDKKYVSRLLDEHQSGRANHRKQIWNLYVFLYWHRTWLE
jgi:asparagine synthase (glutamine-hydrolysing)